MPTCDDCELPAAFRHRYSASGFSTTELYCDKHSLATMRRDLARREAVPMASLDAVELVDA